MIEKLARAFSKLRGEVQALSQRIDSLPEPKDGRDGVSPKAGDIAALVLEQIPAPKDGKDADVQAIIEEVLAKIPAPKDGAPGKDAQPPALADVAALVAAQMPKPESGKDGKNGRDGKDGKNGRDGRSPTATEVAAALPTPERGPQGKEGRPGKDGASVTDVRLDKNNTLFVWLDGVKKRVGQIDIPVPQFMGGGGGPARPAAPVLPRDILRGGWADYINGDLTPITIPAGVETKLTLDASTGAIIDEYLPEGVTSVWDSVNSQFDFSQLAIGDMVDIRVDGSLTNTGLNNSFVLNLVAAIGSPGEFTLPFASGSRFIAGTSVVSRYNGVFIGSEDVRDNPAELRFLSSNNASGFLIDIYIKVLKLGASS